ncbi:MAG TPA: potassium transporter TrkA, partial [Methylotenera mobilis]|nr:potassium transporter TrkA [Methylotenera mobilis]
LARSQTNDWANKLISQLVMTMGETVPETWAVRIDKENSPAVIELIKTGLHVTVQHLMQDPANRNDQLELVPILLLRNNVPSLVPDPSTRLKAGDRILFCGSPETKSTLPSILNNTKTLTYIIDGIEVPNSLVWRWLEKKFKRVN